MADPNPFQHLTHQTVTAAADTTSQDAAFIQKCLKYKAEMPHREVRTKALITQNKQDRHIDEYKNFVKRYKILAAKELDDNVSDDDLEKHCFPASDNGCFEDLYALLALFLDHTASNMTPRSTAAPSVSMETLKSYIDTLSARIIELYERRSQIQRKKDVPDKKELRAELNKCCTHLVREYEFGAPQNNQKNHLGVAETAFLIDFDLQLTKCIALAECHHLAWTLGLVCGLRPGSLGPQPAKNQDPDVKLPYLTFRDCQIQKEEKGRFRMKLHIRNLKTNSDRDFTQMLDAKTLVFDLSPIDDLKYLCLSPTLRVLAIALRRNALKHYSSIEELLNGTWTYVVFKDEFLDQPVMLGSSPRGLEVTESPALATSMTSYLALRGLTSGLAGEISFYDFRYKAASDLARRFGNDNARTLLGHSPDSKLMEKHYLDTASSLDVIASVFNQKERETVEDNTLLLDRLSGTQMDEIFGREIPLRIEQLKKDRPEYSTSSKDPKIKKAIENNIRVTATREVMREYRDKQPNVLQDADTRARKDAIRNHETVFNEKLLGLAEPQLMQASSSTPLQGIDDGLLLSSTPYPDSSRQDMSTQARLAQIPYETGVAVVLKMLLENPISQIVLYAEGRCPLCLQDPTVSEEDKERIWTKAKLKRHIEGQSQKPGAQAWFHSPKGKFSRRCASMKLADGRYVCPYCVEIAPSGARQVSYVSQGELNDHIRLSNARRISGNSDKTIVPGRQIWGTLALARQHDSLKETDGWYDPDESSSGSSLSQALRGEQFDLMGLADLDGDLGSELSDHDDSSEVAHGSRTWTGTSGPADHDMSASPRSELTSASESRPGTGRPKTIPIDDSDDDFVILPMSKSNSTAKSKVDMPEEDKQEMGSATPKSSKLPGNMMTRKLSLVIRSVSKDETIANPVAQPAIEIQRRAQSAPLSDVASESVSKRKSESESGPSSKQPKLDNENQRTILGYFRPAQNPQASQICPSQSATRARNRTDVDTDSESDEPIKPGRRGRASRHASKK